MTTVLNYAICILALLVLGWETWLVAKRNRTVTVAGKDDFFLLCMVMLVAMLLLRPERNIVEVEYLAGQLGGQGPPGKRALQQAQLPDQVQQALAGLGGDFLSVNAKLHGVPSNSYNSYLL